MVSIRENNEGEYSEIGGRLYRGTSEELAVQTAMFTRSGCDWVMRYAFELAMTRPRRHVTSATKSNGIMHSSRTGTSASPRWRSSTRTCGPTSITSTS